MVLYKLIAQFYPNSVSISGLLGASYAKYAEFCEGLGDANVIHVGSYGTCAYTNIIRAYILAGRGCIAMRCGCIPAGCGYINGIGVEFSGQSAEMPVTCIGLPAMSAGAIGVYAMFNPGYAEISMEGVEPRGGYAYFTILAAGLDEGYAVSNGFLIGTAGLCEDTDKVCEGIDFLQNSDFLYLYSFPTSCSPAGMI